MEQACSEALQETWSKQGKDPCKPDTVLNLRSEEDTYVSWRAHCEGMDLIR